MAQQTFWRLSSPRILLLTLALVFIFQLGALLLIYQMRVADVERATQTLPISTLFDMREFLADQSEEDRNLIADLVNTPNLRISYSDTRPNPQGASWLARAFDAQITAASVKLDGQSYLTISRTTVLAESIGFLAQSALLILLFFALTVFIVLGARAAIQPVVRFADAADRLSRDLHAAPMAEIGTHELRQAAGAVNRMQTALQEQVASRTRMIAGIGHDLRTYITRLTLRSEMIEDDTQRKKALNDLSEMTAVINQALDLGRADQPTEEAQLTDLKPFLEALAANYIDMGQPVSLLPLPTLSTNIRPTALTRAIQNVVENAIRYGQTATIALEKEGDQALIKVSDTGPGIPIDQREAVLKPYVRLESSRNRDTGGTGLGLAVATAMVQQQGGTLTLHEAKSGGLEVQISLPLLKD